MTLFLKLAVKGQGSIRHQTHGFLCRMSAAGGTIPGFMEREREKKNGEIKTWQLVSASKSNLSGGIQICDPLISYWWLLKN